MSVPPNALPPADGPHWRDQPPFIDSHRARAVCTRQLARLLAEVARRVKLLHSHDAIEVGVVRSSPDRYIVQLGPVALTVAWLRSRLDSVAAGELLMIVWRGTIAPRHAPALERASATPITTATALWEDVAVVAADSEATWRWCPSRDEVGFTSDELAERCVDRLRVAYDDARVA
jgi:hypothetical protein